MLFKYGGFTHTINDVQLSSHSRRSQYSQRNRRRSRKHQLHIAGRLKIDPSAGDTQADLTALINDLENGYMDDGGTVGLYLDDGTPTAHVLTSADAMDGVNVLSLDFASSSGAEYAVTRRFEATFEAEYVQVESQILAFQESITGTSNGGPRGRWIEFPRGLPRYFQISQRTPQVIVQTGFAVGYLGWPEGAVPNAVLPLFEDQDQRQITRVGGESHRNGIFGRMIRWSYQMTLQQPGDPFPVEL